ncbi:MAG: DUF2520 domain-containing protein [Paludibacteraceae bacterium]|nr:DUF2520 domain-containing protein [Paludibacteraceae bacterium]
MNIVLIGQGNVATNLHHAFALKGLRTQMVSSREGLCCLPAADVYIYAVRDEALPSVIQTIAEESKKSTNTHLRTALHLHTSGTMPISVFGDALPHAGVMYFFQTFSKAKLIDDFSQIPVFVEGRQIDDLSAIFTLAQTLTPRVYEASQHDRERLHVAGVFANNFTNHMYALAADMLKDTHIPFQVLLPLIDQTAEKVHHLSPHDAQTGPAKRRDEQVMNHHLSLLTTPEQKQLYTLISQMIMQST